MIDSSKRLVRCLNRAVFDIRLPGLFGDWLHEIATFAMSAFSLGCPGKYRDGQSLFLLVGALASTPTVNAQFTGFKNHGLVAVGRLSGDSFDALGPGKDTLGGIFSGLAFDTSSWSRNGDESSGFTYNGTFYCVPDRGYGAGPLGGTFDYKPRIHTLRISVTPYYGSITTNQTQISLTNTHTKLYTYDDGMPFTGFSGNDMASTAYPKSENDSLGQGRRSLDPEGLVRMRDGGFFVCDEYGPFIYRFDSNAILQSVLTPPAAWLPKVWHNLWLTQQ